MLPFTDARALYGRLTNNNSTTGLSIGDTFINLGIRQMLGAINWPFLENQVEIDTVDGQQFYELPADLDKVISATITVGTYRYRPEQVTSFNDWDYVNSPTGVESDNPSYFFVYDNTIGFWPIPGSNGNTITVNYQKTVRDLNVADYSAGSIVSIANGAKAVTGTGTTWTAGMEGKYIRITNSNAANVGDGLWYEIASIDTTTTLTLVDPYLGEDIAAGTAAYTISDVMIIPEKYQHGPVYWAVSEYWRKEGEESKADRYLQVYVDLLEQMKDEEGKKTTDTVIDDGTYLMPINPNLDPTAT